MQPVLTPDDKFTLGLWTVRWQARHPFGDPTGAPIDQVETVHRLAVPMVTRNPSIHLLHKRRGVAFRSDPEVQEALRASRVGGPAVPTLVDGESYADLLAERSAYENFDAEAAGAHGYGFGFGFGAPDQLAVEHALGARR